MSFELLDKIVMKSYNNSPCRNGMWGLEHKKRLYNTLRYKLNGTDIDVVVQYNTVNKLLEVNLTLDSDTTYRWVFDRLK